MNIDSELSHLIRRRDPPDGFAHRVVERVERRRPRRLRALAAAAMLAVTIGGWGIHTILRARSEVLTAMHIASQKIAHAQREVNRRQ